jgi:hypothetical protein
MTSVLKWSDKKNVTMTLMYHGDETRKAKAKWEEDVSVLDYKKNMIGIDLKALLPHTYLLETKKMTK